MNNYEQLKQEQEKARLFLACAIISGASERVNYYKAAYNRITSDLLALTVEQAQQEAYLPF